MRKFIVLLLLLGMFMSLTPHHDTRAQDNPFKAEWFNDAIMYEIFVRSFRDSDGDGIGDLQGVIDSLDYIQSLGANTIWLMPVHPSPSYHGYDVSDYYEINPDYGTLTDMLTLIDEAHKRDMHIILDYVANHTSTFHEFFQDAYDNPDSDYSGFYKWADEDHTSYQSFAGVSGMPEVNYDNEFARQYMIDVARFWLDPNGDGDPSDGVDGLRCDVAIGPPLSFWREVRSAVLEINPDALLLGEVWLPSSLQLLDYLQGDAFNAVFDFPTFDTLVADHNANGDGAVSGQAPSEWIGLSLRGGERLYPSGAHLVRFINNHDTNRLMSEVEGDWERAKAAAAWLYTAPGTPMIYYGEEIGMFGSKGESGFYDEYRREPMDWFRTGRGDEMTTWFRPGDRYNLSNDGVSVEEQDDDPASLLNLYRMLGEFRKQTPAMRGSYGGVDLSSSSSDLYTAWRGDLAGDFAFVVINFSTQTITTSLDDDEFPVNDLNEMDMAFSEGFALDGSDFTIEPAGYAVFLSR